MDLHEVGWEGMDLIDLAEDSDRWRVILNVVMKILSIKCWEFLDQLGKCLLLRKDCAACS
jgi:hypothetical protein